MDNVNDEHIYDLRQAIQSSKRIEDRDEYLTSIKKMTSAESSQAPNIITIFMDDMGWGDISAFGSQAIRTPNLDRLAREGAVLRNCLSSSPVCSPSRFGLLTGRYPCRGYLSGVYFPTVEIDAKYIVPQGYENPAQEENGRARPAYIEQVQRFARIRSAALPTNGILEDEITIAAALRARGYKTGMFGKWHLGDQSPHLPNDMGFDYFFGAHYSNDMCPYHFWRNQEIAIEAPFDQSRITDYLNDELFSFIERHGDEPFFAYYASPWPHHPLNCGKAFAGRSAAGTYGDCIEEFDYGIGQLLELLETNKITDKTLIVFTSDNGPWHQGSTGGHRGRKGNNFDGGQLVPTVFWSPGRIKCQVIHEQSMNIDFFPTFCDLTGITLPHNRIIDGCSLWSLLSGQETSSPHNDLYYMNLSPDDKAAQAIRSRDHFKYLEPVISENSRFGQLRIHSFLFNLNFDPDESYDVKNKYPEKFEFLKSRLAEFNCDIRENPRGWLTRK